MHQDIVTIIFGWVFLGEMLGTMLLVFWGDSGNALSTVHFKKPDLGEPLKKHDQTLTWLLICLGWGFGLSVGVAVSLWIERVGCQVAYDYSTASAYVKSYPFIYGLINPGFDVAMWFGGVWAESLGWGLATGMFFTCLIAQLCGAMIGAWMVDVMWLMPAIKNHQATLEEIRGFHCTGPSETWKKKNGKDSWQHSFIVEFAGAITLQTAGIIWCGCWNNGVGIDPSNAWSVPAVALTMGIVLWGIGLFAGDTGFAVNPARDFGPRLVFAMLPLKKYGYDKKEQMQVANFKYGLLVPVLMPLTAGVVVCFIAWADPMVTGNAYFKSPFVLGQAKLTNSGIVVNTSAIAKSVQIAR